MKEIIYFLNERGFFDEDDTVTLYDVDIDNFLKFVQEIQKTLKKNDNKITHSAYNFYASTSISGISGCGLLECKLKRAREFSFLACLYSEKTYISLDVLSNPCIFENPLDEEQNNHYLKEHIINEIAVILAMREPISKGIINIIDFALCPECYQNQIVDNCPKDKIDYLEKYFLSKVNINLIPSMKNDELAFCIKGLAGLTEHDDPVYTYNKQIIQELLYPIPENILNKTQIEALGIVRDLVTENYYQGMLDNFICDKLFVKYLTNLTPLHNSYDSIRSIGDEYNNLLEFKMPFFDTDNLVEIIKLRNYERESFLNYQTAIHKAINEASNKNNKDKAVQIYDDLVSPAFIKLDLQVKNYWEKQIKSTLFSSLLCLGTFMVSQKAGLTISETNALAAFLGGSGLTSTLKNMIDIKPTTRENEYYFLWKLNKKIKK